MAKLQIDETLHAEPASWCNFLYCSRCYAMITQLWGSQHSYIIYYHTITVAYVPTSATGVLYPGAQRNRLNIYIYLDDSMGASERRLFQALLIFWCLSPKLVSSRFSKCSPSFNTPCYHLASHYTADRLYNQVSQNVKFTSDRI
jgi:hypothetical protein